jgi:hypothetical protein
MRFVLAFSADPAYHFGKDEVRISIVKTKFILELLWELIEIKNKKLQDNSARDLKNSKSLEWPQNIGKRHKIKTIWGTAVHLVIEDEIMHQQTNAPHKLIAFQKIRIEEEDRIEFRFGYYMIGVKAGAKGRWVWGQFSLLIPEKDLSHFE